MNEAIRYKYWFYMAVLTVFIGCRKDLCYDHFNEMNLHLKVAYSLDWHLPWDEDWSENWPAEWSVDWDKIFPKEPEGVRLHIFDYDHKIVVSNHNLESHGGQVTVNNGCYDMLLYNNDTERIIFENMNAVNDAVATTRISTRAAYSNKYPDEITVSPPDVLFAAYVPEYELRKQKNDEIQFSQLDVELTPRTWTYLIRYEFIAGQEYVAEARAYLSGMAGEVSLKDGYTSSERIVTLLLECSPSEYGVESIIRSFGLPDFDYQMVKQKSVNERQVFSKVTVANKLVLEMTLLSGKIKVLEFDVTNQVRRQPRGGVIVVKDITVTSEEGQKEGGSGFNGNVSDWEENIDVDVPIL